MTKCHNCFEDYHAGESCEDAIRRNRKESLLPPPRNPSGFARGHYTVGINKQGIVSGFAHYETPDPRKVVLEKAAKLTKLLMSKGMEPAVAVYTALEIVLGEGNVK